MKFIYTWLKIEFSLQFQDGGYCCGTTICVEDQGGSYVRETGHQEAADEEHSQAGVYHKRSEYNLLTFVVVS